MGFGSNGKKTLYRLIGLTRIDFTTITNERAKENNQDRRAVINFDCNNIVYFVRNRARCGGGDGKVFDAVGIVWCRHCACL